METNLLGFKLSGYGEVSYVYSTNDNAGTVTGHLYDRFHDQFTLNGLKLVIDRPYATDKVDAGVQAIRTSQARTTRTRIAFGLSH